MLVREKVNQAKKILKEFNIDCWITFVRESELNGDPILDYILGSSVTWHSAFIITSSGKAIAIVGKYDQQTVEDTAAYDHVYSFVEGVKSQFIECMKEINPAKIAINYSVGSEICDGITYGMYLTLHEFLTELGLERTIISAEKIISALRQRKTAMEIDFMKNAISHTEDIFAQVAAFIKPGKTEKEIAEFMKQQVHKKKLGFAWDENSCPAVFTGPDTAGAHYAPTDRKVESGHILNMDFGVRYNGYCSDLQRTFYVLKDGETEAPEKVKHGFNTIVESIESGRKALKPGVKGLEIDGIVRNHVVKNGYEEFPHGTGHQVGRFAHDGTALIGPAWEKYAQKPFQIIEDGMVFTLEPRLTVPNYGIATVEEMVLVTKDGAEFISTPQREIVLIG